MKITKSHGSYVLEIKPMEDVDSINVFSMVPLHIRFNVHQLKRLYKQIGDELNAKSPIDGAK